MPTWACGNLLRKDTHEFNTDTFTDAERRWSKAIAKNESLLPLESVLQASKNPEEVLAYVEAVAGSEGSDLLRFRDLLEKNPKEAEEFMRDLGRAINNGPNFAWTDVRRIVRETYRLSNQGKRTGYKRFLPVSMDSAIEARVRRALKRETPGTAF